MVGTARRGTRHWECNHEQQFQTEVLVMTALGVAAVAAGMAMLASVYAADFFIIGRRSLLKSAMFGVGLGVTAALLITVARAVS